MITNVSQREFMDRWGMISFGHPDDKPMNATALEPKSGFRVSHDGTFYRYSGIDKWYRPALWWEHLIVLTWGRLFWFKPSRRGFKHRWVVSLCDHQVWGLEFREYRTKIGARIGSMIWLAKIGRGTFYTPPHHLELLDVLTENMVSRTWPL